MSVRGARIHPPPGKPGYVHNSSKGHYTEEELVKRRANVALKHGAKWFDFKGERYILRDDKFVEWWR